MFVRIAGLLFLTLFCVAPALAHAGEIEVSSQGNLRIVDSKETWSRAGISVEDDVLQYGNAWKDAFKNPNTVVPVSTTLKFQVIGLSQALRETIVDRGVRYDSDSRIVRIVHNVGVIKTATQFNPFFIFVGVAFLLMIACDIAVYTTDLKHAIVFACVASFFAFAASIVHVSLLAFFSSAVAIGVAAIVAAMALDKRKGLVFLGSAIFYTLLIVATIAMYV